MLTPNPYKRSRLIITCSEIHERHNVRISVELHIEAEAGRHLVWHGGQLDAHLPILGYEARSPVLVIEELIANKADNLCDQVE